MWFKSYLINWLQYASINIHKSSLLQVKSGVSQGSILGPSLFIIYVNDLSSVINNINSYLLEYADDTKYYKQIATSYMTGFVKTVSNHTKTEIQFLAEH